MTPLRSSLTLAAALLLVFGVAACDTTGTDSGEAPEPNFETLLVENLPADPDTTSGPGRPQGRGQYVLFDLRDDEITLASSESSRADSASAEWDIGLQSINVIVNGGASGPGQGAGYVAEQAFSEVEEVDTSRLQADAEGAPAIEDWYTYNANGTNIVRPTPGRTLVVRTADGASYAKIRVLSYYEGNPDDPAESNAESRYYTFEYRLSRDTTFE